MLGSKIAVRLAGVLGRFWRFQFLKRCFSFLRGFLRLWWVAGMGGILRL